MKAKKLFYIIEPIDVDGDKIPDGFLASQYRIDKYGNKIFTKNKYITYSAFKSKLAKKGGIKKALNSANPKLINNNNDVVVMSKADFNKFMNQNAYNQQYPHNPNNPYPQYPQYPPGVLVNNGDNNNNNGNQNTFMGNMANAAGQGFGAGFGFAAGDALFDGIASFF